MYKRIYKRQRNQIKLQISAGSQKKLQNSRKTYTSASLTRLKPLNVQTTTNWKILKEMGIPDHLSCLLRNLYVGEEATGPDMEPDMEQWTASKLG